MLAQEWTCSQVQCAGLWPSWVAIGQCGSPCWQNIFGMGWKMDRQKLGQWDRQGESIMPTLQAMLQRHRDILVG